MRNFKRHIFTFIFLSIGIFFIKIDRAYATWLDTKYYTLQCIYSDGGLYTRSLDFGRSDLSLPSDDWYFTQNRTSYNLVGASEQEGTSSSSMVFVNKMSQDYTYSQDGYVRFYTCRQYLKSSVFKNEDDDGANGSTTYYKFVSNKEWTFDASDLGVTGSWYNIFGIQNDAQDKLDTIRANTKTHHLVSDSVVLKSNAPEPTATYYYVQKAEQASGSDKYIKILVYDNVVLLQSGELLTQVRYGEGAGIFVDYHDQKYKLQDSVPETIYINSPEPMISTEGSAIKYSYNVEQTRYKVSTDSSANNGKNVNKYTLTLESDIELNTDTGELCKTIMPQTAIQLRRIIKIAQILIPVLLIVLVGFDFGKIVMSGNLEEELPKQKKKIIRRLVVAITFFFLPIIATLIINLMRTSGDTKSGTIELIGCLFQ